MSSTNSDVELAVQNSVRNDSDSDADAIDATKTIVEEAAIGWFDRKFANAADRIEGGDVRQFLATVFGGGGDRRLTTLLNIVIVYAQNAGSILAFDVAWPAAWLEGFTWVVDIFSVKFISITGWDSTTGEATAIIASLLLPVWVGMTYALFYNDRPELTSKWDLLLGKGMLKILTFLYVPAILVGAIGTAIESAVAGELVLGAPAALAVL